MFHLRKLYIENFLSIERVTIDFEIKENLFILIKGWDVKKQVSNGAGKSAIIDAILFCLFKTTMRGKVNDREKLKIAQLIKRGNKGEAVIACELIDYEDNRKLKIVRKITNKGLNKVVLYENDEQFNEKSTDIQNRINRLLLNNFTIFDYIRNNVFVSTNYYQFFALSREKKIRILESLITQFDFARLQKFISEEQKNRIDLVSKKKQEIIKHNFEIDKNNQLIEKYKEFLAEVDMKVEKESIKKEIKTITGELDRSYKIKEMYEAEIEKETKEYEKMLLEILKVEKTKKKYEVEKRVLNKSLKDMKTLDGVAICPLCGSEINPENIKQEFEKISKQVKKLIEKIGNVKVELKSKSIEAEDKKQSIENIKEKLSKLVMEMGIIENKKIIIQKRLNDIETQENSSSNKLQSDIDELLKRNKKVEKDIKKIENEIGEITKEIDKLAIFKDMFQNKSQFKVMFLRHIFDDLNILTNQVLKKIFDKNEMELKWYFDDSNDISIYDKVSKVSYFEMSSGEKRIVDIVILFLFLEISMLNNKTNLNLILMDEPFEHLDRLLTIKLIQLLRDFIYNHNIQLFFISHSNEIDEILGIDNDDYVASKIDRFRFKISNYLKNDIRLFDKVLFAWKKENTKVVEI